MLLRGGTQRHRVCFPSPLCAALPPAKMADSTGWRPAHMVAGPCPDAAKADLRHGTSVPPTPTPRSGQTHDYTATLTQVTPGNPPPPPKPEDQQEGQTRMHVPRSGSIELGWRPVPSRGGRASQTRSTHPETNAHRPSQPFGHRGRGDCEDSTMLDRWVQRRHSSQVMRLTFTRR